MVASTETVQQVREIGADKYKYGFSTDIDMELAPKGVNEDIVRMISAKKGEPEWLLEWRLKAFRTWQEMPEPHPGRRSISGDRLSGRLLLRGAERV